MIFKKYFNTAHCKMKKQELKITLLKNIIHKLDIFLACAMENRPVKEMYPIFNYIMKWSPI